MFIRGPFMHSAVFASRMMLRGVRGDFLLPIFHFQLSNFSPQQKLFLCGRPTWPLTHATWNRYNQSLSKERFLRVKEHHGPQLAHTISLLTRTPAALNAFLRDLPETWTSRNEGENTWSVFDIVGHPIHGERTDWMPRARMILQFGETKAFEPFDRWGQEREVQGKSLEQLLDEFARLRSENLCELRGLNLRQEHLARRGRHPALGVATLSQLLATWAAHDLTHLHQIY